MTEGPVAPPNTLDTSVGTIAFHDAGVGPPVLLLHGFPASSWQWRGFLPLLEGRFRVVSPDLPGAGASRPPAGVRLDLRLQTTAVRELLAHLGIDRVAVVAHGAGGGVARSLALDAEAPAVDALVLLNADVLGALPAVGTAEVLARLADAADGDLAAAARAVVRETFERGSVVHDRLHASVLDTYAESYASGDGPERLERVAAGLAAELDAATLAAIGRGLGRLDIPVLILWGEDDPFVPATAGERVNDAMPSSTLGLLPGCGHFLVEEAADTIAPMISEYLRARYAHAPHGHADPSAGVVMLQLERRPPWVDLEEYERDDWFDVDDESDEADRDEDDAGDQHDDPAEDEEAT